MNLWDDFWKFFFPLPGAESPREMLFRYVLEDLLKPKQIDLYTEQYARVLSFFATLLLPIAVLGLVVSLIQCITHRSFLPFKQWLVGVVYLLSLVVIAPFVFTFFQYLFALIGSGILTMMMNTDDIEAVLKVLMQLTGDSNIDATLGLIQVVLLLLLALELKLVVVALYVSAIAVMIGLTLRFVPWIGEPMFAAAIKISIFGMFGYLYVLFALALIVGGGRILTGTNALTTGFLNVVAIGISVIILWKSISNLFGQLNAVVQKAIEGYQERYGRPSSRPDGHSGGPDKDTLDADEAADHLKGTRHGHGSTSSPDSAPAPTDPAHGTTRPGGVEDTAGKTAPRASSRTSATAKRLATEAAKKVPEPEVQAAARAAETAEKVRAGAEAVREGNPTQTAATAASHGQNPTHTDTAAAMGDGSSPRTGSKKPGSHRPNKGQPAAEATAAQYQERYRHPQQQPPEKPRPAPPRPEAQPQERSHPTPRHEREPERRSDT